MNINSVSFVSFWDIVNKVDTPIIHQVILKAGIITISWGDASYTLINKDTLIDVVDDIVSGEDREQVKSELKHIHNQINNLTKDLSTELYFDLEN